MYVSLRDRPRPAPPRGRRARVVAPVVLLGVTSMFTDISSEMVAATLPLFVTVPVNHAEGQARHAFSPSDQCPTRAGGSLPIEHVLGHRGPTRFSCSSSPAGRRGQNSVGKLAYRCALQRLICLPEGIDIDRCLRPGRLPQVLGMCSVEVAGRKPCHVLEVSRPVGHR